MQITQSTNRFNEVLKRATPEQKLLILCSRLTLSEDYLRFVKEVIAGAVDWQELLQLSRRHLVTPMLFNSLYNPELAKGVPQDVLAEMRKSSMNNLARNMKKRSELLKILNGMEENDINVVVLKGNALVHFIYGNEGLRVFTDIDLLIPGARLEEAKKVLSDSGYRRIPGIYPFPDEENEEMGHEWVYQNPDGDLVELQWRFMNRRSPFGFDPHQFIERCINFKLDGHQVCTLSIEDQLIHLSIHQFKHHWQRLRDLCDINEIAAAANIDWDALLERSGPIGADKCVYYTFLLARDVLDAPIPEQVIRELANQVKPGLLSKSMLDLIEKNILSYQSPHGFWPVILVDGFRTKAGVILGTTSMQFARESENEPMKIPSRGGLIRSIPHTIASLREYRKLIWQLMLSLARNMTAKVAILIRR